MNSLVSNIREFLKNETEENLGIKEYLNEENFDSSDSDSNENTIIDEYKILIISIIKRYNKKRYRDIFTDIGKNKNKYKNLNYSHNLIFTHFQFRCLIKIIENKFSKYCKEKYIKGIDNCFNLYENLIKNFTRDIERLSNEIQIEQYEYLTYFYLNYLYYYALLKKHENNILECLCYLSLAEKIIQKNCNKITYSKIYRIIEKIYLFITSFLIGKNNYFSAKNYLYLILELCYKDLLLTLYINKIHEKEEEEKDIHQIFFNMLIAFYQLGCIFENQNNIEKADTSYQQSKCICNYFLLQKYPDICFFIKNVSERMRSHYFTFKLITEINFNIEDFRKKKKKIIKTISTIDEEKKIKKCKLIENNIEKIPINEIDDDHKNLLTEPGKRPKSNYIEKMVKNLTLLNYLTSDEFKPTITNLKQMHINKIDPISKRIIQKKIISIKNEEKSDSKRKKSRNVNCVLFLGKTSDNNNGNNFKRKRSVSNHSFRFKTINTNSIRINIQNNNNSTLLNIRNSQKTNTPLKIKYDKFIFNKNYMNKNKYLETQIDREYQFHKNILKTKRYELINIEPFNYEKAKSEADLFYNLELDKNIKLLKDKNKSIKSERAAKIHNIIIEKMKYYLKEKTCKSLNTKDNQKYKDFIKKLNQRNSQVQNEKLLKIFKLEKVEKNNNDSDIMEDYNLINEDVISKIENDIEKLDQKEFLLQKIKSKLKTKNNN